MKRSEVLPFDLHSAAFHADRFETYRALRDDAPLTPLPGPAPTVLVTRYADIVAVLRDREVRMLPAGYRVHPWLGTGAAAEMFLGQMLFTDLPEHTRMRPVTAPAFRPRTVDRLRAAVDAGLDKRIAHLRERGTFDAVADLAEYVPAVAICTILGIPAADWPALIRGAADFALLLSPVPLDGGQLARLETVAQFYLNYFRISWPSAAGARATTTTSSPPRPLPTTAVTSARPNCWSRRTPSCTPGSRRR